MRYINLHFTYLLTYLLTYFYLLTYSGCSLAATNHDLVWRNTTKYNTKTLLFRPHRNTTYLDAAYCYRRRSVFCWSITIISPAKPLNRPRCRLGCGLGWAQGTVMESRGNFEEKGSAYSNNNLSLIHI